MQVLEMRRQAQCWEAIALAGAGRWSHRGPTLLPGNQYPDLMSHPRFPLVRLTHPTGPSDQLDPTAGVEFYLDSDTSIRVCLLKREAQGDWVVQVSGMKGSGISVEDVGGMAIVAGKAKR